MSGYTCAGCGEPDSIVEVSLVPRIVGVVPVALEAPAEVDYSGLEEAFWDAETVLGYACTNVDCDFYNGNYGVIRDEDGARRIVEAPALSVVALIPSAVDDAPVALAVVV